VIGDTGEGQGVKEEEASKTADNAAAMRATHLIRHGLPKIFEDSYAIQLTNRRWQRIIGSRFLYWLLFKNDFFYGWIHPVIGQVVARARYAEEQFELAIRENVSQYVLLGAGMDSFALRRPDLAESVAIIEIDHPATQQLKKKRLSQLGIPIPKNLVFVPVDFERESVTDALSNSAFSKDVPAFFSWLGTTIYLEKSAVLQTLGDVASCPAKGSKIAFDCGNLHPSELENASPIVKRLVKAVQRRGEPILTGFHEEELRSELHRLGFEIVERLSSEAIQRRYFLGRHDGLTILDYTNFVCARVARAEGIAAAV
jgi:methyltransferase (TIGR00027 family)